VNRERNPVAMPRLVALLLGITCCALATRIYAQPAPLEAVTNPEEFLAAARQALYWDVPTEPAHLAGPIYFVGTKGLSSYLIKSSEGLIVLNTGMPGSGPMIEASIRKLGFDPKRIKLLLANHAHVDHVGGHAHLQALSGAEVAVIAEEKELIESGGKRDFHYAESKAFHFDPVRVARILHDGDILEHGGIALTVMLTPGHTQGSTSFAMSIAEGEKMLSVVFPNGASVNPGYRVSKNPSYPGIGDDFQRTFRVFESLAPDIWLSPHTETIAFEAKLARAAKDGASAWIDREGYKKWIAAQREKFEAAVESEANE
jgi:metallo-beta-lactamase class B